MRNVTQTVKIYKFDELSEEAKGRAINYHLEIMGYDQELWLEMCKDELETIGFIDPELSYSLLRSQGDGAAFKADFDHEKLIDYVCKDNQKLKKQLLRLLKVTDFDFDFIQTNYHYTHENTYHIEGSIYWVAEGNYPLISTLLGLYVDLLNDLKIELCEKFKKSGYEEIKNQNSDEYMSDLCEANGYEFLENGKFYHCE